MENQEKGIISAIHSTAGIQLREECAQIMKIQGYEEPTGQFHPSSIPLTVECCCCPSSSEVPRILKDACEVLHSPCLSSSAPALAHVFL